VYCCCVRACAQTFNEAVPKHELGEGNAGLVVVRNGSVQVGASFVI
jgi:hypothetical protein